MDGMKNNGMTINIGNINIGTCNMNMGVGDSEWVPPIPMGRYRVIVSTNDSLMLNPVAQDERTLVWARTNDFSWQFEMDSSDNSILISQDSDEFMTAIGVPGQSSIVLRSGIISTWNFIIRENTMNEYKVLIQLSTNTDYYIGLDKGAIENSAAVLVNRDDAVEFILRPK